MKRASSVLMVRPLRFRFNEETLSTNSFQSRSNSSDLQIKATSEFDSLKNILETNGIRTEVFEDVKEIDSPDSIFPNNWISFHENRQIVLYPMQAPNRRRELRWDLVNKIKSKYGYEEVLDLSALAEEGLFLEGTGSLVLDSDKRIAYAALSERTNPRSLQVFEEKMNFKIISFHSFDRTGSIVYHTNVMMSLGEGLAVICLSSISNRSERTSVRSTLEDSGFEILDISMEQMHSFAGNILQLQSSDKKLFWIMSESAFHSFSPEQIEKLTRKARILSTPLSTIERVGGGSARCMLAEIFDARF